ISDATDVEDDPVVPVRIYNTAELADHERTSAEKPAARVAATTGRHERQRSPQCAARGQTVMRIDAPDFKEYVAGNRTFRKHRQGRIESGPCALRADDHPETRPSHRQI